MEELKSNIGILKWDGIPIPEIKLPIINWPYSEKDEENKLEEYGEKDETQTP